MPKDKRSCGPNTKPCHKPYKFDLEVKGQRRIGIMNVCDTSFFLVIGPCALYGKPMSKKTEVTGHKRRHAKHPVKFYFEVKGQRRIGIVNVRKIPSRGNRSMCQIWYCNLANVK